MITLDSLRVRSYVKIPTEVRASNMAGSLSRDLPCIDYGKPKKDKVAVVAGGPSVEEDLDELRNFDGYIVAINGAHDWLISHEITPDAMIMADAHENMAEMVRKPQMETTYMMASWCDPKVFDALKDHNVILWHAATDEKDNGTMSICTGPSGLTAAPLLLYVIGYREIHLYGADSSLSSIQSHIYKEGGITKDKMQVLVGTDVYLTTAQFVLQAAHLWDLKKTMCENIDLTVHGYGLAKAIFSNNGKFKII